MIDSTKSPVPLWRRYATIGLLVVMVLVVGWFVWTKEIHKSSSTSAPPAPAPAATQASPPSTAAPTTTIPGGLAVSTRNPFGG